MPGRGQLPNPNRRRRNKPLIPTTKLPFAGRTKDDPPAPDLPSWWVDKLGDEGRAWWDWAWSTPQSFGWSVGDLPFLARRAWLEEVQHEMPKDKLSALTNAILNMDHKLGLSPKGLAELRWTIVGEPAETEQAKPTTKAAKAAAAATSDRRLRIMSEAS